MTDKEKIINIINHEIEVNTNIILTVTKGIDTKIELEKALIAFKYTSMNEELKNILELIQNM